jgi:hypothetical protein
MDNPTTELRSWRDSEGKTGKRLFLWCPGCDSLHSVEVENPAQKWEWDGNRELPTISPSILVNGRPESVGVRCHSYVKRGRWEFLSDCEHDLAGQKDVPLVPLPDWIVKD